MPEPLDPTGVPVEIDGVILRTPGLEGSVETHAGGSAGMRAAEQTTTDFERAMSGEGLTTEQTIAIGDTNEVDVAVAGSRSTSHAEPAIELDVAAPTEGWGQLVLSADESGVMTWNFSAEPAAPSAERTRGGERRTYVIRRAVSHPPSAGPTSRGLIGAVGKKILKVIAFKLLDPIGAVVGDYFAGKWEQKKRPYRFRPFTPDDFTSAVPRELNAADWQRLGSGRALLMIHGTTSRAHTAFGALPRGVVEHLHNQYDGRVFAFDHFTLSEDPRQNVGWFVQHLPEAQQLDVDIICHSRGGLVSRMLAERQSDLSLGSRRLEVGKIVFAAAPNSGTILSNGKYMSDFIDAYTNLLNFLPDTGVLEALEGLITVAKQLAVGALGGLDGLQSMNPSGDFLHSLNSGEAGASRYYALAANYEPVDPGFRKFATDRLLDKIFRENNDLVVPTNGVFAKNGKGGFPIDDRYVFDAAAGVSHTTFFGQKKVHEKLAEWLA